MATQSLKDVVRQKARFDEFLDRLRAGTQEEVQRALDAREPAEPEAIMASR